MHSILHEKWGGCFLCGNPAVEEHHVFGGPNRANSEKYGLKVYLCHAHHNEPPTGVHFNADLRAGLQAWAQAEFERVYPQEDFVKIFGRNYR
jgi:hypothetical protein